jgi:hypothetical protein
MRTAAGVAIAEKRTDAPLSWNIVVQTPPAEDRAAARKRRRSSAKWRCGVRNMPKFAKLTGQCSLAILEEVMRHFFWKAGD